ncbi:hypothetical protein EOM86_11775 [Candidatus Nomurabacteria bacterium]|nr:hypothetical protein [Candidatus Nomurabacteria bacterium]
MILNLTLKKVWFDMISSGEKTEEYREIKDYWITRIMHCQGHNNPEHTGYSCKKATCTACVSRGGMNKFIPFDTVVFRNGYRKDAPVIERKIREIRIGRGRREWGAEPYTEYIVIEFEGTNAE